MENKKHYKLPWKVEKGFGIKNRTWNILNADDQCIIKGVDKDIAELIIQACNSYEELLKVKGLSLPWVHRTARGHHARYAS